MIRFFLAFILEPNPFIGNINGLRFAPRKVSPFTARPFSITPPGAFRQGIRQVFAPFRIC